ncbi:hypothetical protein CEXT_714211 [Caerostris extrusa]|uniref:Uncharacterized protein n=1 Tax=Caerostris extrusa TaxID=172846 RepID=A0AAV4N612_CAEEX|nr:hypothetical protein CEXT_714211 [Caerostris extrusa]
MQISEGVEESAICGRRHLFRIEVTLPEIRAPAAAYACQRAGRAKSQLGLLLCTSVAPACLKICISLGCRLF